MQTLSNMFGASGGNNSNTLPPFVRRGGEAELVAQVNAAVARSYRDAKRVTLHPIFEDVVWAQQDSVNLRVPNHGPDPMSGDLERRVLGNYMSEAAVQDFAEQEGYVEDEDEDEDDG